MKSCGTEKSGEQFMATQDFSGEVNSQNSGESCSPCVSSYKTTHLLLWQAWVEMYVCLPVPVTVVVSKGEYVAIVLVFPFLLFFHKLPIKTCNTLTSSMFRARLKTQPYSDFWQNNLLQSGVCYDFASNQARLEVRVSNDSMHPPIFACCAHWLQAGRGRGHHLHFDRALAYQYFQPQHWWSPLGMPVFRRLQ